MPPENILYGKNNLHTHVFSLMHDLSINHDLVHTNAVVYLVCRVRRGGNLNFTPLLVRRNESTFRGKPLELFIDTLLFDTSFTLNERGLY